MTPRAQIFARRLVEHCFGRSNKRQPAAAILLLALAAVAAGPNPLNPGQGGGNPNQNPNQNPAASPPQIVPGFVPGVPNLAQAQAQAQAQAAAAQAAAAQAAAAQAQAAQNGVDGPPIANGPQNPVPTAEYYRNFAPLYDGDYRRALDGFQADLKYALRTGPAPTGWVDSICYYTMIGESHYKMGQLSEALDNYNAALRIYLAFPAWMKLVRFPQVVQTQSVVAAAPWGHSARGAKPGRIPDTMLVYPGVILVDPLPSQYGLNTYGPAVPLAVNVKEIVRCTTLAMKRRQEILGPIAPLDKLSDDLASLMHRRPAPRTICSDAWVDAQRGMAYLALGQTPQATECLQRAVSLPGQLDHTLTPLILLQLGELSLQSGDLKSAANWFEEASYSALQTGDFETLEEAFRYGQQTHLLAGPRDPGPFKPLGAAIAWSRSQNHDRELHASLLLSAAENSALSGTPGTANSPLGEARGLIGRRDMAGGEIGSRLNYLSALVAYRQENVRAGDAALGEALAYQKTGSKWLFQIGLADEYIQSQTGLHLGWKRAQPILETVLRDPTGADWASNPLESLAVLSAPHPQFYQHWFETIPVNDVSARLEVADRARRHRFLSTLPLGGRLLALRWILEAPRDSLDQPAQVQRQELLTHYPQYAELSKQVARLRTDIAAAPLGATGAEAERKQAAQLADLGRLSSRQETLLREMAVRREAADLVFPPIRKSSEIQAALKPGQLLLMFFCSGDRTYAWLMSSGRCVAWKLDSQPLEAKIAALLRAMGNVDGNHEVPQKQLADDNGWRQAARDLTDAIVADSKINLNGAIDELIVVPDGALWYLPFETLQISQGRLPIKQDKKSLSIIGKTRVRYLPTMGLAMPGRRGCRPADQMGVVLGKLNPHDDPAAMQAEFAQLGKVASHVSALKVPLPAPSPVYGAPFDTLVVLDDLAASERGAAGGDKPSAAYYEWSPIQLDRVKSNGSLSQWFALPWKAPAQIILPGFHTPAEMALRQQGSAQAGNDLFLSVCGLMSTGARTILISRWRTGGQSSYELVRQFAQELPYSSAADAWQRGVQLLADDPVEVEREPRVQRAPAAEGLTARHPFFWSGYMLVNTGWTPPADKPLADAKK